MGAPAELVEKAVQELKDLSGSHFDPVLVDNFNEVMPEILKVKERYQDSQSAEEVNGSGSS